MIAENYFKDLFTSAHPNHLETVLDSVDSLITPDMNVTRFYSDILLKKFKELFPNASIKVAWTRWYVSFLFSEVLEYCRLGCHRSHPIGSSLRPHASKDELYPHHSGSKKKTHS